MSITVVSGWTGRTFDKIGQQFMDSLHAYWPTKSRCAVYVDPDHCHALALAPVIVRPLTDCIGLAQFIERHKDNKAAHGRVKRPVWRASEAQAGYSYRTDAVKFATQMFIPGAASRHLPDGEILVWFDADVVFKRPVPADFVEGLLGDADLCYLGRGPKHSEIGFWAVRLSPLARDFLEYLVMLYCTDELFELWEWHSAFVFDEARRHFVGHHDMKAKDLTPGGMGHVWESSPLQRYSSHLKGKRKFHGLAARKITA